MDDRDQFRDAVADAKATPAHSPRLAAARALIAIAYAVWRLGDEVADLNDTVRARQ